MHASWKIASAAAALLVVVAGAGCAAGVDEDDATLTAQEALDTAPVADPATPPADPATPGTSVVINQNGAGDRNINIIGGHGHHGHGHHGQGHHGCGGHGQFHHGQGQGQHEPAAPSAGPGDQGPTPPPAELGQGQG